MNREQAMGKWSQLKGRAKQAWSRVTGDKATQVEGAIEELQGVIQEERADADESVEGAADTLRAVPVHR